MTVLRTSNQCFCLPVSHISICTVNWMGRCSIEPLKLYTPDIVQHWRSNRYTKRPIITLPKWQGDIFQTESTCTPMLWNSVWIQNRTSVNESVLYVACLLYRASVNIDKTQFRKVIKSFFLLRMLIFKNIIHWRVKKYVFFPQCWHWKIPLYLKYKLSPVKRSSVLFQRQEVV